MIAALVLAAFLTWAQQASDVPAAPPSGGGVLTGRVTFDENSQRHPLRRATVIIEQPSAKTWLTTATDKDGAYRFEMVPVGAYRVRVTKAGFVPLSPPVEAAGSERARSLDVRMERAAALEGRFIDSNGEPIVGLDVGAERLDSGDLAGRGFSPGGATAGTRAYSAKTDDLGRFRIHTIPAGRYIVHALPPPPASGLRLFYPGTEKRTEAVELKAVSGETIDNLFITVPIAQLSAIAAEAMAAQTLEAASAPATGPESARISGRVTRSDNGQPIPNAALKISTVGGRPERVRITWTDGEGEYTFSRVIAGTYTLTATVPGYVSADASAMRPEGELSTLKVADGNRLKSDLSLTPLGAIEGRVLDEFGDPAPGVYIQVGTRISQGGNSLIWPGPSMAAVATDDRGRFRIAGLFPADYYAFAVSEPFAPSSPGVFPITFYPGTTSFAAAAPINVAAGASSYGVDLSITATRAAAIAGTAVDIQGRPMPGAMAVLLPVHEGFLRITAMFRTIAGADGRFSFSSLPEGSYVLQGMGADAFGSMPVTVVATSDGAPQTVSLLVKPNGTVSGRFVFEGGSPPDIRTMGITFRPTDFTNGPVAPRPPQTIIKPDATFQIQGIASPGVFLVNVQGWVVSRILLHGRDIAGAPYDFRQEDTAGIEVILTKRK